MMERLQDIKDFFNNQSVGAFIGAFAAFTLVVLNDWRRDRRKIKNIAGEIEINRLHAKGKLDSLRKNLALIREQNKVLPAAPLKFNTVLIRQLAAEVLSRLLLDQRRAIDGLCYMMEATDRIIEDAYSLTKTLGSLTDTERSAAAEKILVGFNDAVVNLKRLDEMCSNYIARNYSVILTKQFRRVDYEEN